MSHESSLHLIERARAGDQAAINTLIARYLPRLQRWATGRLPNWARDLADTQDLVQETVYKAFRQIDRFEVRGDDSSNGHATVDCATLHAWGPLILLEQVGRGCYGVVYRAWDSHLDREVALKLLRAEETSAAQSPTIEEGRLLARIRHPNVVTVRGADRIAGQTGIWMEFVEGRTLEQLVREGGPMSALAAARIVAS